jgi:D-alanyl-D-alanine carboxypeptidase (penicillin-binding protein 5/6)
VAAALGPAHAQPPAEKPLPPRAPAEALDGPPVVTAKAWAVADGKTGKVLWGSKEKDALPIASTTKIMTAHVVLTLAADDPKVLDEVLTFSEAADKVTGTTCGLNAGDKVAVRDLLYGLLLPSGNDAAHALAEHFGPRFKGAAKDAPVACFVAEMNRIAKGLGMGETSYLDPHGLGRNVSSPRDLAALALAATRNPAFAKYVATRRHTGTVTDTDGKTRELTWANTNKLLDIDGYEGIKTGTTNAAGSCLVSAGTRGGDRLIVVVLGSTSNDGRYADARNLYRWAWSERAKK